jgi:hypothetical protein
MGFNIHILSGRNRSTNLAGHAALAASFNPHVSHPAEIWYKTYIDDLRVPIHCTRVCRGGLSIRNGKPKFRGRRDNAASPRGSLILIGRRARVDDSTGERRSANIAHVDVSSNALRLDQIRERSLSDILV